MGKHEGPLDGGMLLRVEDEGGSPESPWVANIYIEIEAKEEAGQEDTCGQVFKVEGIVSAMAEWVSLLEKMGAVEGSG